MIRGVVSLTFLVGCFDWESLSPSDASTPDYRPRPGAYRYTQVDPPDAGPGVVGLERYDISGNTVDTVHDGVAKASVTFIDADCWDFDIAVASTHYEHLMFCGKNAKLVMPKACGLQKKAIASWQQSSTTTFACTEGDVVLVPPNDVGALTMVGTVSNGVVFDDSGTINVVDRDPITIGGSPVASIHVRIARTQKGSGQDSNNNPYKLDGTETTELWFAAKDATVLRFTRATKVTTTLTLAVFGNSTVNYVESTGYTLMQLDPDVTDAAPE
jgi:hypothetical protein